MHNKTYCSHVFCCLFINSTAEGKTVFKYSYGEEMNSLNPCGVMKRDWVCDGPSEPTCQRSCWQVLVIFHYIKLIMTLYCSCIQLLTVKSDSVTKARGCRCASPCIYLVHYTYELIVDELILSVNCESTSDEIGAFVCVSERIMKLVLGEGKGGEKNSSPIPASCALLESCPACWLQGVSVVLDSAGMQREVWEASKAGRIILVCVFLSRDYDNQAARPKTTLNFASSSPEDRVRASRRLLLQHHGQ